MAHRHADGFKLDNPLRRKRLPPMETLSDLGLGPGEIMADIGCGIGYFSFPAAAIVGPAGKVYALDISEQMLKAVEAEKNRQNIANLEVVRTEEYDLKLASASVTFAFVCNVLHGVQDLERFTAEVRRLLAADGRISIIEWGEKETGFGPPLEHRLASARLVSLLERLGFSAISRRDLGEDYYAISAQKREK